MSVIFMAAGCLSPLRAQAPIAYTFSSHYGYILPQNNEVVHLAQHHAAAFELCASVPKLLNPAWARAYKNLETGLTFIHFILPDYNTLGSVTGLGLYAQPYIIRGTKQSLTWRLGTGLGYNPVVFSKQGNPTDVFMSSRLTAMLQIQLKYSLLVKGPFRVQGSMGLTHFSNGSIKLPNQGINLPTFSLGLQYRPQGSKNPAAPATQALTTPDSTTYPVLPSFRRHTSLFISGALALVEIYPSGGPKYPYYIASAGAVRRIGLKSSLTAGAEYFNNTSIKHIVHMPDTAHLTGPYGRIGIFAGHTLHLGRLGLLTQMGWYAYKKTPLDAPVYQRIGLQYALGSRLFAGVYLKTHYGSADCIEWSLGGTFW